MSGIKCEIEECDQDEESVVDNSLPDKSGRLYKQCYDQFVEWQKQRKTASVSEDTILIYFDQLSKKFKPSSLWAKYSMLKSMVLNSRNINIGKYSRLTAFLSKNGKGYTSTKSKTLAPKEVEKFLSEAPDNRYLAIKVALILGITGACRREELKNVTVHDIEHHDNMIVLKLRRTKNNVLRKFTIDGEFYKIVRRYEALRPKNATTDRFFLTLRNGKCTQQVIGINTFGAMPKVIAEYLGLEQPERYTGHCFRRTSVTMLTDAGADLLTLKRHGGWKSDKVAQGYIDDSISGKKKICNQACSSVNLKRQSSIKSATNSQPAEGKMEVETIVNNFASGSSDAQVSDKENSSDAANITSDKKVAIQPNNCNKETGENESFKANAPAEWPVSDKTRGQETTEEPVIKLETLETPETFETLEIEPRVLHVKPELCEVDMEDKSKTDEQNQKLQSVVLELQKELQNFVIIKNNEILELQIQLNNSQEKNTDKILHLREELMIKESHILAIHDSRERNYTKVLELRKERLELRKELLELQIELNNSQKKNNDTILNLREELKIKDYEILALKTELQKSSGQL